MKILIHGFTNKFPMSRKIAQKFTHYLFYSGLFTRNFRAFHMISIVKLNWKHVY